MKFEYRPWRYFTLVFVSTFTFWGVGAWMSLRPPLSDFYMLPMLLGLMAPFVVAIWMIWTSGNRAMLRDFSVRLFDVRLIRKSVFILMLGLMPVSVLAAIGLSVLMGGSTDQFQPSGAFSFSAGFIPVLLVLLLAAVFEELGWRGYGFESLHQHFTFLTASLIFGVLWSAWHLPLLFVAGSYQYEIYHANPWFAANFYVSTVVMGVIISWVCARNRRSILAAIVFHFVINLSQEMLSMTQETKAIQTGVLTVFTVLIVLGNHQLFFQKNDTRYLKDASC